VALVSEADERLLAGPRGEQGKKGDRGEHGLSWRVRWAIVVLFVIAVLPGVLGWFWLVHVADTDAASQRQQAAALQRQVTVEQAKWCSLIVTLDQANAAAPKRPVRGTFTAAFVAEIHALRQSLGCGS
jgi:hypothetical protein